MMIKQRLSLILGELQSIADRIDEKQVAALSQAILAGGTVFAAGAGRSGLVLRCAAMRLMHMDIPVYLVGEIVTPAVRKGDLLLVASGSGQTASLVGMATKAKQLGARVALITATPDSAIAKLADVVVLVPATTPKADAGAGAVQSRQPMGNLFEQTTLLTLDAIIMNLMEETGKTSDVMFKRHANLE